MVMCSKCHKRVAVVFYSRFENGETINEGVCLQCAKEMGLPIDNMLDGVLEKMGIPKEELENMEDEIMGMISEIPEADIVPSDDSDADGKAPAIDFSKLFGEGGFMSGGKEKGKNGSAKDKKAGKEKDGARKYLDTYCQNLTAKAIEGKLDRIVGRDRELARVIQILCRRQKNNPCLIGEPGVGKTAIAEALAMRIAEDKVPFKLKGHEVHLLDLTALVAGTQFRGQFESRVLGLINEVKQAGNIILVIDEVHNIVGVGDAEGSMNAANMLKPALSRGEIQVLGATTLNEYRKHIEKDTALERRFQPVMVNEPSVEESVEILKGIKRYYEDFHNVKISDEILRRAVILSERYITDRYLPDKAIDLVDEAASHVSLSSSAMNESLELRQKLLSLKKDRDVCEAIEPEDEKKAEEKYKRLANIKVEELKYSERIHELEPACERLSLEFEDLARVIEIWTGISATSITENEFVKLDRLEERLKGHIIGQDVAVNAVARAIKRNRAGISYKRKPVSFIFAGPTGVGKTELVKRLASDLFDSPETLIRLDMSEFMEKHSVSRIIGSPPGYVGYDEAGQLTEKIRRRPYSIVLFDEIEKAHPDVLNILLQILDDGRITDAHGKQVNFENTVIVMTTNAGSDNSGARAGFSSQSGSLEQDKTTKALEGFLRPEFLNRVDEIITFRSLERPDFERIAVNMLDELVYVMAERGIKFTYSEAAVAYIAENSFSYKFGARNMRRYIQTHVEDALASEIISHYNDKISVVDLDMVDGELKINCL